MDLVKNIYLRTGSKSPIVHPLGLDFVLKLKTCCICPIFITGLLKGLHLN
jgi:hypothetical protein